MGTSMMANGKMGSPTASVSVPWKTATDMKEDGRMASGMAKEKKHGPTRPCTREIFMKARDMDQVFLLGQMAINMKANSR